MSFKSKKLITVIAAASLSIGAFVTISATHSNNPLPNTMLVAHASHRNHLLGHHSIKDFSAEVHKLFHGHHKKHLTAKGRAKYVYKLFTKKYHLSRKHAVVLTGVAEREVPHLCADSHQRGGGAGYGIYQVNKNDLRRWCRHHHVNYKTLHGQVAQFYHCFVKHSGFLKSKGSIAHEAKVAERNVIRSAIPASNRTAAYARNVLRLTK